ncbi:hypothetical protein MRX96_013473 [Rhipicephalus microplus]
MAASSATVEHAKERRQHLRTALTDGTTQAATAEPSRNRPIDVNKQAAVQLFVKEGGALLLHHSQRGVRLRFGAASALGDHQRDVVVRWDSRPAGVLHVWHNRQELTCPLRNG